MILRFASFRLYLHNSQIAAGRKLVEKEKAWLKANKGLMYVQQNVNWELLPENVALTGARYSHTAK